MFIVVALVLGLFVSQYRLAPDEDPESFRRIGRTVPAEAVVMAGNAPALHYYTGLSQHELGLQRGTGAKDAHATRIRQGMASRATW